MNKVKKYFYSALIGVDQLGNTLLGGDPDETISSRIGRLKSAKNGIIPWSRPWMKILDFVLETIQKDHSIKAIEKDLTND